MTLYQYVFKNDYDKSFHVKDREFFCYSKKRIKAMYFDKDDYKVLGETLKKPKDSPDIKGTLDMGHHTTLDVFDKHTHKRRFYKRECYICVGQNKYIVLLRKRVLFW